SRAARRRRARLSRQEKARSAAARPRRAASIRQCRNGARRSRLRRARSSGGGACPGHRRGRMPAPLQRLAAGGPSPLLPAETELWLDGAHNEAGGAALGAMAETWRDKPLRLVFGMLKTHDARAFLSALAPFAAGLEAIAIPGEANALSATEAAEAARSAGIAARAQPSIRAAVQAAALPRSRVLICGSLYLAGRVLAENGTPA